MDKKRDVKKELIDTLERVNPNIKFVNAESRNPNKPTLTISLPELNIPKEQEEARERFRESLKRF